MIYETLLILITVLIIYTSFEPPSTMEIHVAATGGLSLLLFCAYAVAVRIRFHLIVHRVRTASLSIAAAQTVYRRSVTMFSILAVFCFAVHVYLLNLKALLDTIPGFQRFSTLSGLMALSVFFGYLISVLWAAYPVSKEVFGTEWGRFRFIMARLRIYGSFLVPWFVLSWLSDLFDFWSIDLLHQWGGLTREIVLFSGVLAGFAVFAPVVIRVFWGLKPLSPGPDRSLIEEVCIRNRFTYRDITLWPLFEKEVITAGVMGLIGRFRYILISPPLLSLLNREELAGVIVHEIGHIKKYHMVFYLLFLLGYLVFAYPLFTLLSFALAYTNAFHRFFISGGDSDPIRVSIAAGLVLVGGFVVYFRFVFGFFMRNFERQADLYSLERIGRSEPLVRSLEKIALWSGSPRDTPSWHHFSIRERVEMLLKADRNPELIRLHDHRVRRILVLYLAMAVFAGAGAGVLEHPSVRQSMEHHLLENLFVTRVERNPHDASARFLLGAFYLETEKYGKAEELLSEALSMDPDNADILNNLAWLYATSPDPDTRNEQEAVHLAERAARLQPAPHILDTLAEAYYRANRYREAVETAERIPLSSLEGPDRSHFEAQLEKFREALFSNDSHPETP